MAMAPTGIRATLSDVLRLYRDKTDLFLGTGAGIVVGDIISSAVASGLRLTGRAHTVVKLGVRIPVSIALLWLGAKMKVNPDVYLGLAAGAVGGIVSDLFKLITGVGPDTYGDLLGMTISSWIEAYAASIRARPTETAVGGEAFGEAIVLAAPEEEERRLYETGEAGEVVNP